MNLGTRIVIRTKLGKLLVGDFMRTDHVSRCDRHRANHLIRTTTALRTRSPHRKGATFNADHGLSRRRCCGARD